MHRITIAEWARIQVPPISRQAAYRRVSAAKIKIGKDGLIDQKEAETTWNANQQRRSSGSHGTSALSSKPKLTSTVEQPELTMLSKVNIKLKVLEIEQQERKNKLAQGALVERSKVQAWAADIFTAARKSFQSLPTELVTEGYIKTEDHVHVDKMIEKKLNLLAEFR